MSTSGPSAPRAPPLKLSTSTGSWKIPRPTDVILYSYLWRREHARGEEEGRKVRPCLVLSIRQRERGLEIFIAPITTRPYAPEHSIALPPRVCAHLGLDELSRIVWNDLNLFTWVGPDVRPAADGAPFLGRMPERLWREAIDKALAARVRAVPRTE